MPPINPIELEKSVEHLEADIRECGPTGDKCIVPVFYYDLSRALCAAKERLQQLKGGDVKMPESNYPPLTSPEPVTATGRGAPKSLPSMTLHPISGVRVCLVPEDDYIKLNSELITAEKERDELKDKYGKIVAENLKNAAEAYKYFHELTSIKGERDSLKAQLSAAEKARDDYAAEIYRLAEELRIRREKRQVSNKGSISPNQ